ncbi:hypothetical protein MAUB1S_01697 [Mycolicibacterium aubagnense]
MVSAEVQGFGNVRTPPSRRWQARYRDPEVWERCSVSTTFTTKKAAIYSHGKEFEGLSVSAPLSLARSVLELSAHVTWKSRP